MDYLKELNPEQYEAATTTEGYIRVVAGAGSGKTKTLTARFMYLVEMLGISTSNILCVTFTNKAAAEMKKRIRKLRWKLWRHKGVDIVVTHAPPKGYGDSDDRAHRGFEALLELVDKYHPQYLLHGHVHLRYGADNTRVRQRGDTQIINVCERYVLEIPDE